MEVHRPGLRRGMMDGVRTANDTFPGAGAQGVLDDLVDGAGAPAAFGAAAEAAIDLPCRARQVGRSADHAADVLVTQHIAGTNDQGGFPCDAAVSILNAPVQGKAKRINFKQFQTAVVKPSAIWNESKQLLNAGSGRPDQRFRSALPASRCLRRSSAEKFSVLSRLSRASDASRSCFGSITSEAASE